MPAATTSLVLTPIPLTGYPRYSTNDISPFYHLAEGILVYFQQTLSWLHTKEEFLLSEDSLEQPVHLCFQMYVLHELLSLSSFHKWWMPKGWKTVFQCLKAVYQTLKEAEIVKYLSLPELSQESTNHSVPILDVFRDPSMPDFEYLVMPLSRLVMWRPGLAWKPWLWPGFQELRLEISRAWALGPSQPKPFVAQAQAMACSQGVRKKAGTWVNKKFISLTFAI